MSYDVCFGCTIQESELFDEMKQVAVAAAPDEILFVLDSTIGQAAYDQARAFKDAVAVGGMPINFMA